MKHAVLGVVAVVVGCSSSPANVAGNYTVATTNRDNGCNFQNWTVGATASAIPVVITQSNASVTVTVNGLAGAALDLLLSGHIFTGSVDGDTIDATITGTRSATTGNCTYTYNATIRTTLSGDTLTGRLDYVGATNNNSDCTAIQGCDSYTDFNGTRPPT